MPTTDILEKLVSLCKRRGFVFQSSEIYGGLGSVWDYGPLGIELKRNLQERWWTSLVRQRDDIEGIDSAILMHPRVWEASGHVGGFVDPLVDCRTCKGRFRADKLEDAQCLRKPSKKPGETPDCALTEPRQFNLMFRTHIGPVEDSAAVIYLRPETAQGTYVNFLNVQQSTRQRVPFGIAQIGKSFRNEITPGNFIFRTREFEQMEMEYFVRPEDAPRIHQEWIDGFLAWIRSLGISEGNLKLYEQTKEELAHYSERTVDILYRYFPERGDEEKQWDELMGIANRTDYDLRVHSKKPENEEGKRLNPDSTEDLSYFDDAAKQRFYPYVIEPAIGVNRTLLAVMMDAYSERTNDKGETRIILKLAPELAPIKAAVLPLAKNKPEIVEMAKSIKRDLQPAMRAVYDDTGGIGKLYARQDEIGTPFCVTIDHESLEDQAVTVRDRDTWEQERIGVSALEEYLKNRLKA